MALKILLADDSMTAQNLGKKILTDAGHEVVAVSNGAAAMKKIASEKPQVVILDVYMPGYSGLEVCEKLKANPETASVPVLLTVGKMEAYQPEEGNRVKADGVMIKPFEASDLLAAMERFAQKLAPPAEPAAERTLKMAPVVEEDDESYAAWKSETPEQEEAAQAVAPTMQMSAEVAAAPAFGLDEEPAPPAPAMDFPPAFATGGSGAAAAPAMEVAPAPAFGMEMEAAPAFEIPTPAESAPAFEIPTAPEPAAAPAYDLTGAATEAEPAPAFLDLSPGAETAPAMVEEAIDISAPAELEYNAAAPVEVAATTAPELETTAVAPGPETVIAQDSALVTNADDMAQFATKFGVENPESIPVGIAQPAEEITFAEPAAEPVMAAIPDISVPNTDEVETQKIEVMAEEAPAMEAVEVAPPVAEPMEMDPTVRMPHMDEAGEAEHTIRMPSLEEVEAPAEHTIAMPRMEEEHAPAPPVEEEEHFVPAASNTSLEEEMRRAFSNLPAEPAAAAPEASAAGAEPLPASASHPERVAVALERVLERNKAQLIADVLRELKNL